MINIRRTKFLRRKALLGKLIRLPLKLLPQNKPVSIFAGPLKGKKYISGSHNQSIIFGLYEKKQSKVFLKYASNTNTFWDLGSHVGYYSLLYNVASPKGKIAAFEPVTETVEIFKKHMALNSISDFKIFPYAVSDKDGVLSFKKTSTSVAGKLDESGESKVEVVKLSRYLSEGLIAQPDIIKMDIEGGEVAVLGDLKQMLIAKKPSLFLSTHGKKVHEECLKILNEIGYRLTPLDSNDLQTAKELLAYK